MNPNPTAALDDMRDPFVVEFKDTRLELAVHADNAIGEPRICWRTEDGAVAGKWGLIQIPPDRSRTHLTPFETIEVAEPRLVFGRDGDARPTIAGSPRDYIALPDDLGEELRTALEALGTVEVDASHIETDPDAFPSVIRDTREYMGAAEWDRQEWDSEYNLMWYTHRGHDGTPRAYQLVDGTPVWRKHSWKTITRTKRDLIDKYEDSETA